MWQSVTRCACEGRNLGNTYTVIELSKNGTGVITAWETEAGGPIESEVQEQSGKYTKMVLKW